MSLHPALRRALSAPPDDEPVTDDERRMIQEAEADTKPAIPLEQLLKEFGGGTRELACEPPIGHRLFEFRIPLRDAPPRRQGISRRLLRSRASCTLPFWSLAMIVRVV